MKKKLFLFVLTLMLVSQGFSQDQKRPLDFKQYDRWNTLSAQKISDNGEWIVWEINPVVGDGNLYLMGWGDQSASRTFSRGSQAQFGPNSDFLAFRVVAGADTVRKARIAKAKTEKMPKDTLSIYRLSDGRIQHYPRVKNFKVAQELSSWMAFQLEEEKKELKPEKKDTTASAEKKEEKPRKKPESDGVPLYIVNPVKSDSLQFPKVTEYGFSKKGTILYLVGTDEDSVTTSTLRIFNTRTAEQTEVWKVQGFIKGVISDEAGNQLAFLFSTDTTRIKKYSLYHWDGKGALPVCVVDSAVKAIPDGWSVSENGRMFFSPDGRKLFFTTAPDPEIKKEEKDTLLADDRVQVDIWHWQEDVLQSMQVKRVDQERKRSYQAVYHIGKKEVVQLAHPDFIENYQLLKQGDQDLALGFFEKPYRLGNAVRSERLKDVYLTDLKTGEDQLLFSGVSYTPAWSPEGRYLYWWDPADSSWYCHSLKSRATLNLTGHLTATFVNEDHDTPQEPGSYGQMGWAGQDRYLFLYDRYDIWKLNPEGKEPAVSVTNGYGARHSLRFRYHSTDPEEKFIDTGKENLFSVMNLKTKQSGYYRFTLDRPELTGLVLDDCRYGGLTKAKNADRLIWTRSSVTEYPDLWLSDGEFRNPRKVSLANPQQADFIWADAELVEWNDLNGEAHQGILYKPENLDPSKKYPLIVYFYERHSDGLHTHYTPRASASTVNPLEYASNGYLIFMPDIHFIIGLPGRSFYNAIMSGIAALSTRAYVDMEHLGIQGQSWGGYGTAYMITQTDIFAAASPGAPVSNMTSAYGGIRNESGMVRQSQYEKSQSRIGGTLWEKPEYFIENSPLFYADRINTPCLIRHDDADGAVPFSEGVQLFVALRRLGKPAWLVNYNNAPHNLSRLSDKKDWSVRMMQFFDHYLKGAEAPAWMTEGVRAVDKKKSELYYWPYTQE